MQEAQNGAAGAQPRSKARIVFALLAAALVIIAAVGVFLPWAETTNDFGSYSESLADGDNGGVAIMLVPLAIIAGLAGLGVALARRRAASISLVSVALGLSVLFTGFSALVMVGMVGKEREINTSVEIVSVGLGAFVTIAAIGLLTAALIGLLVSIVRVKRAPGAAGRPSVAPAAAPAAVAAQSSDAGSGWYPDPFGDGALVRYHDGRAWTGHTAPRRDGQPVPGAA